MSEPTAGRLGSAAARGMVVFLTGLSGAGKSTIARALQSALAADGHETAMVDGDELRRHRSAGLGFDRASRDANVKLAAELAADAAREGRIAIAALIAPFEASRRAARAAVETHVPFLLVYVRTPIEVAEARDPKGLYRRARAGEIREFTGIDSPYEEPVDADLVIDTTVSPVEEAAALIRAAIAAAAPRAADRAAEDQSRR